MKRIALILIVIGLLLSLAACDTQGQKPGETTAQTPSETAGGNPSATDPAPVQTTEAPFEPIVLADNDVCTVRVLSMGKDEIWGFRVVLSCENKTETTLLFSADNCSIQGFYVEPAWILQVDAGETKESDFNVFENAYERCGFAEVEEFHFWLLAKDMDNYGLEPLLNEEITLYPTGKTAEELDRPERQPQDTDLPIAGDDRFSAVITKLDPDGFWGYTLEVYLVNNTDRDITFNWKDIEVNGVRVEPYWIADMPAGLKGYADLILSKEELESKNLENLTDFDFILNVYDSASYDDLFAEHCTVVVK